MAVAKKAAPAKKAAAAPKETKAGKQAALKTGTATATKPAKKAEEKGPGKIEQIIALHVKGKSNAEIVEAGFNKTTVAIQVAKYKKSKAKK